MQLIIARGLRALILTALLTPSLFAEFLYKDDVIQSDKFAAEIENLGADLKDKTGVGVYVVAVREIDGNRTIVDLEKDIMRELNEPAVILAFSEFDKKIDIFARPVSLYKDFDKDATLSPIPAFGGTIIPLLTAKSKDIAVAEKYAAALGNGYADIVAQIASSRGVELDNAVANTNKDIINLLRILFYGTIAFAIMMYIRQKFFTKKNEDAKETS